MTREEAKHRLLNIERCTPIHTREDARDFEALEMAIQALSQEPCDDVVSRILTRMWNCRGKHTTSIDKVKMEQIIHDELPVTQKAGKWIWDNKSNVYRCSCCNQFPWRIDTEENDEVFINMERTNAYKFCPNCGAKMVEPQESEDKE